MAEAIARIEAGSAALPSVDALFLFLEDLRRDGYPIDARHIAAAQCLLAEARAEGAESPAARRIKFRLAPLIAKSPSQQQDFYRRFDAWQDAPVAASPASEAVKRDPRRRVIAGAVAAFLALAVVATWYFWPSPSPPQEETVVPPQEEVVPPGEAVDLPRERFEIAEQVVSPFYAGLKAALAAAPLFAFAAWFFVRWRRRLLLMSRGVILGEAPLGSIQLPLKLSDVLFTGPELRASAHDLRRHRYLPTHKLDAWRTVDATARRAGLFTPVYRERPQLPEYVFLIEQNGSNDHLARLFDLAVDRLRDEHVEIQRFYFHTDPRQVQADDRERSSVPLAELAARTDDHRLFIIATADGFFHPLTGEVESWVQRLEPWRSRTMLSTRPLEQWTVAELRLLEEGFSLATAEASGFAAASEKIAAGTEEAELLEGVVVMPTPTRLDLFSGGITPADRRPPQQRALVPASLDDAGLIEAIPNAGIANAPELAAEAGRRRLDAAVPALERLCRRFVGFGFDRTIPEQLAAVEALAMIGGPRARQAIVRIIVSLVVQGPGLVPAIAAAVHLGADLPTDIARKLLRHPDPRVRADACGCIGTSPAVIPILLELMGDLDPDVRHAAACALGRLGRPEARAALTRLLREQPSQAVIDAITPIADEECVILLGRIARTAPDLADAAACALGRLGRPEARAALTRLLREQPSQAVIDAITPIADEECFILLGRIARTVPDLADAAREALEAIDHPRAAQVLASIPS